MQVSRQFEKEDQLKFASLSGDFNPMHMDSVVARRTQAGALVVHGIHILLWLLDAIARNDPALPSAKSVKVRFAMMVYVGESVTTRITHQDKATLQAEVLVEGLPAVTVTVTLGQALQSHSIPEEVVHSSVLSPAQPLNVSMEDMTPRNGRLMLPDAEAIADMFPDAARYLSPRRLAALSCSSYLVGMVVPGLHSIYSGLSFDACEDDLDERAAFQTTTIDSRFNLVMQDMWGGGISAKLETFVRSPPVRQASLEEITPHIVRGEFAGTTALIIGGSRGLGELTAKIITAGGGKAIISYARGRSDADRLVEEMRANGGNCEAIAYNVLGDAAAQLEQLHEIPSHVYYFATSPLVPRPYETFSKKRYDDFFAFYGYGFERLVKAMMRKNSGNLCAFYPSSVAVEAPPRGMIEYAKAKETGEELCAELQAEIPSLHITISRLPRMLTDLTATVQPVETADPLEIMLPIIRDMHKLR